MSTGAVAAALAVAGAALALLLGLGILWSRERTKRVRLERELSDARSRAARVDQARETFFDLATHELRSPLAAILGYQELLRDGLYGQLGDAGMDAVDRVGRSARHLLHMIDGIVELSRLRTGEVRPELGPVDTADLLRTVGEDLRRHGEQRGVSVEVDLPEALTTIHSDRDRLVRILDLLLVSAVKHPGDGTLTLTATGDAAGFTLRLDGAAVPLRSDNDDIALRLGLRLAIVHHVASLLGGSFHVHPENGSPVHRLTLSIPSSSFDEVQGAR